MKINIFKQVFLPTLLGLTSILTACQDQGVVDDIEATPDKVVTNLDAFKYSYRMTLLPDTTSTDALTRAQNDSWQKGDTLYMVFGTSNYGYVKGYASYQEEDNSWNIITDQILEDTEGYYCTITYIKDMVPGSAYIENDYWRIKTTQFSSVFRAQWASYYITESNGLAVRATLGHYGNRLRFHGTPGSKIEIIKDFNIDDGLQRYDLFSAGPNGWTWDRQVTQFEPITVGQDGYTPYITFSYVSDNQSNLLALRIDNEDVFVHGFHSGMLNGNDSFSFTVPTEKSYKGWSAAREIGDFTYLLIDSIQEARVFNYQGEDKNVTIKSSVYYGGKDYAVKMIGNKLFYENQTIETVDIPESVEVIGSQAFYNCSNLTELVMPKNLKRIEYEAFQSCNIKNIVLNDGVEYLGARSFNSCSNLISIKIPSTVKEIGSDCFAWTNSLATLILPEGVEKVENGLAYYSNVSYVKVPSTVKTISNYMFHGSKVAAIDIAEGVESIDYRAFSNCQYLKKIDLPSTVKRIDNYIISDNQNLEKFIIRATDVPEAYSEAFYNAPITTCTLYVPSESVDKYKGTAPWSDFTNIKAIDSTIDSSVSPSTNALDFDYGAGKQSFTIKASQKWALAPNQSWLTLSSTSGDSNATITVTAEANTGSAPRTAIINVSDATGVVSKIVVTQKCKVHLFSVPSTELSIAEAGSTETIALTANDNWTAESNASWLTLSTKSGSTTTDLSATASSNAGGVARSATVTLTSETGKVIKVIVRQAGSTPTLSSGFEATTAVPVEGKTYTVNISSNTNWDINVVSGNNFCSVSKTSGSGDGSFSVRLDENKIFESNRKAVVIVTGADGKQLTFEFKQQYPALVFQLSNNEYNLSTTNGDRYSVQLTTNAKWVVETTDDSRDWAYIIYCYDPVHDWWSRTDRYEGTGSATVYFEVNSTDVNNNRTGHLIFTASDGTKQVLTITQSPRTSVGKDEYEEDIIFN